MGKKNLENKVDLIFETSWEVCNKVGGIYTVLSTKTKSLAESYPEAKTVFIGPDVWSEEHPSPYFTEYPSLLKGAMRKLQLPLGVKIRVGRWNIPGKPIAVLVDFQSVYPELPRIFGEMWQLYGVDSLHAYGDYNEGCAFAVASGIVISGLIEYLKAAPSHCIAHFDEWTAGMGLLYLQQATSQVATVFTTHATSIGRSICGNGKPLYDYFHGYNGDQMACELNMQSKHSLEKQAAWHADAFTTVSGLTGMECTQLLEKTPDVITPNGFESDFVPAAGKYAKLRGAGRRKLLQTARSLTGRNIPDDTFIVATAGRNEYRNKGLDVYIDALNSLRGKSTDRHVLALILVPAWVKAPGMPQTPQTGAFKTHFLNNEDSDAIACRLRDIGVNRDEDNVTFMYVPCYLDGNDGVIDIAYYDLMPALDATVFASYYEPWGYTPLESIAFGIPTISTDKSGFGQWIERNAGSATAGCGVKIVERTDSDYGRTVSQIADTLCELAAATPEDLRAMREAALASAQGALWSRFIQYYEQAYDVAMANRDKRISEKIVTANEKNNITKYHS